MANPAPRAKLDGPFFTGMALLVVAVIAGCAGLWLVWTIVFEPEPSNIQRASEAGSLAIALDEVNRRFNPEQALREELQPRPHGDPRGPSRIQDRLQYERVREAAQWVLGEHGTQINAHAAMTRLVERQEADVRAWRFRRAVLFALPSLALGVGAGWFGVRILRRLNVPGTVFAVDSQPAGPAPVEPEIEH